ncbi:hypothetical protein [Sanguibacter sp. HDW7]|uniref:hypothetical protein n=1 Tax=Sanguibacter sp. HDW7 TaxID=2714931 RepID=UPI00140C6415|nr:hypothetical protein [Sanguibacter sp. HDW7]QIK83009.1 hypothetical protein G7063_04740 [Sanguibacter sp. HDW7]
MSGLAITASVKGARTPPTIPDDVPFVVIVGEHDQDPEHPALRFDIHTNAVGDDAHETVDALAGMLHALSHAMTDGARLDLSTEVTP